MPTDQPIKPDRRTRTFGQVRSRLEQRTLRFLASCPAGQATISEINGFIRVFGATGLGRIVAEWLDARRQVVFDRENGIVTLRAEPPAPEQPPTDEKTP